MGARRAVKTIRKALLLADLLLLSLQLLLSPSARCARRWPATTRHGSRGLALGKMPNITSLAACKTLGLAQGELLLLGLENEQIAPDRDRALKGLSQHRSVRQSSSGPSGFGSGTRAASPALQHQTQRATRTQKDARRHDPPTQGNTALGEISVHSSGKNTQSVLAQVPPEPTGQARRRN